jgi:hypothetical protein
VAATFAAQPAPPSLGRPLQLFDTKVADLKGAVAQRAADGVVASARTPLNPQRLTGTAVPPADRAGKAQVEAPRPAELDERRRARAEDLPGPTVGLQRAVAALELAGPVLPLPPAIPQAFEALLPQLLDDSSLRMVLGPTLARVSVDTGDLGQLSLQLRVRDGVTEIRAGGPAAPNLEQKQNELRVALASEGLSLGHFDLAQSHSQQRQDRPDVPDRETPPPPPAPRPGASTSDEAAVEGRVHVKA